MFKIPIGLFNLHTNTASVTTALLNISDKTALCFTVSDGNEKHRFSSVFPWGAAGNTYISEVTM